MINDWVDIEEEPQDWVDVKPASVKPVRAAAKQDPQDWVDVPADAPPVIKQRPEVQSTIGSPRMGPTSDKAVIPEMIQGAGKGMARTVGRTFGTLGTFMQKNPRAMGIVGNIAPEAVSNIGAEVRDYYTGPETQELLRTEGTAQEVGAFAGDLAGAIPKYANPAGAYIAAGEAGLGAHQQFTEAREQGSSVLRAGTAATVKLATDLVIQKVMMATGGQAARALQIPGLTSGEIAATVLKDLGINATAAEVQVIVDNATAKLGGADPNRQLFEGSLNTQAQGLAMNAAGYLGQRGSARDRLLAAGERANKLRELMAPTQQIPVDATGTGSASFTPTLGRRASLYAQVFEQPQNTAVIPADLRPTPDPTASPVARPPLTDMYEGARNNIQGEELARVGSEYESNTANVKWKVDQLEAELEKKGKLSKPKMKRLTELRNSLNEERLGLVSREGNVREEAIRKLDDTNISDWLDLTPRPESNAPDMIASEIGRTPNFEAKYGDVRTESGSSAALLKRKAKAAAEGKVYPDFTPELPSRNPLPQEGKPINKLLSKFMPQERIADIDPQMEAAREPLRKSLRGQEEYESRHSTVREGVDRLSEGELDQVGELLSAGRRRGSRFTPEEAQQVGVSKPAYDAYAKLPEDYRAQMSELRDAAMERYQKTGSSDYAKEAQYYDKLMEQNPEYVPFARPDDYYIAFKDGDGKNLAMVNGKNTLEVKAEAARLLKEDPSLATAKQTGPLKMEIPIEGGKTNKPNIEALGEAARILKDDYGIELGVDSKVLGDIYRSVLAEKSAKGFAKRLLNAKLTPGESRDFIKSHFDYTKQVGRRVMDLKYGEDIAANINELRDIHSKGTDLKSQEVTERNLKLLQDEWEFTKAGGTKRAIRRLSGATTVAQMGFDLAQAAIQPLQKVTHSYWTHKADLGADGAAAWARGNKVGTKLQVRNWFKKGEPDHSISPKDVTGFVPDGMEAPAFAKEVTDALVKQHQSGEFMDVNRSVYQNATPDPASTGAGKALQKGVEWAMKPMQIGEYNNRVSDFIGAYMGYRKQGVPMEAAEGKAVRLMERANNIGGDINTSAMTRNPVGAIAWKFKAFPTEFLMLMQRNASKTYTDALSAGESKGKAAAKAAVPVVGPLVLTSIMAGYKGIPFITDAWEAVRELKNSLLVGSDEEGLMDSLPQAVEEWSRKHGLPQEAREAISNGVFSLLGIDMSGRLGMDRVLGFDSDKTALQNIVGMMTGANQATVEKGQKAAEGLADRDPGKLAEGIAPRGLVNLGTAITGNQTVAGGEVLKLSPAERLAKAAGFQSMDASRKSAAASSVKKYELMKAAKTKKFADDLKAQLDMEDPSKGIDRIAKAIDAYNEANKDNPFLRIEMDKLMKSAIRNMRSKAGADPSKNRKLQKLESYYGSLEPVDEEQ